MFENELLHEWGVWFCFVEGTDSKEKYDDTYNLIYSLKTPSDLAYVWNESGLSSLSNFLLREDSKHRRQLGYYCSYFVAERWRKVNSLEFFKKGIQPKWEDPKNAEGGRFIISIPRSQENNEDIYRSWVFFVIGESFDNAEHITGFRFVSSKHISKVRYRAEIWVDFNDSDNESLSNFAKIFTKLIQDLGIELKETVRFFNNKADAIAKEIKQWK